jgi:hypothetical protein
MEYHRILLCPLVDRNYERAACHLLESFRVHWRCRIPRTRFVGLEDSLQIGRQSRRPTAVRCLFASRLGRDPAQRNFVSALGVALVVSESTSKAYLE